VTRQSYAPDIRIVRVMCTGRIDLSFLLRAFQNGADGVIIGGCWPGECHYVTEGNYDALGNLYLARKLLAHVGLNPDRLRLEWIAASEGSRFAEVMSDFAETVGTLGPLGEPEGLAADDRKRKLDALARLVPYLRLVEREKLRVPTRTEAGVRAFFESAETDRLFHALIADKLAIGEILACLGERPQSTGELAERLGLSPSDVSRHMSASSRQGLVRYDVEQQRYALA